MTNQCGRNQRWHVWRIARILPTVLGSHHALRCSRLKLRNGIINRVCGGFVSTIRATKLAGGISSVLQCSFVSPEIPHNSGRCRASTLDADTIKLSRRPLT